MYAVAVGDPFDGMRFYGPFEGFEAGQDWAERHIKGETWWMVPLCPAYDGGLDG